MVWLTYALGAALFAFGLYSKAAWMLTDWSAYLPVLFGLAYATCAEGMRTLPARRRVFLAVAIVLSILVLASVYPLVCRAYDVSQGKPVEWDTGKLMQPLHVYQAVVTSVASAVYLIVGLTAWFRSRSL